LRASSPARRDDSSSLRRRAGTTPACADARYCAARARHRAPRSAFRRYPPCSACSRFTAIACARVRYPSAKACCNCRARRRVAEALRHVETHCEARLARSPPTTRKGIVGSAWAFFTPQVLSRPGRLARRKPDRSNRAIGSSRCAASQPTR
jgi:hypothetical protein